MCVKKGALSRMFGLGYASGVCFGVCFGVLFGVCFEVCFGKLYKTRIQETKFKL